MHGNHYKEHNLIHSSLLKNASKMQPTMSRCPYFRSINVYTDVTMDMCSNYYCSAFFMDLPVSSLVFQSSSLTVKSVDLVVHMMASFV